MPQLVPKYILTSAAFLLRIMFIFLKNSLFIWLCDQKSRLHWMIHLHTLNVRTKSKWTLISSEEWAKFRSFYEIIPRNDSKIIPRQYCAHLTLLVEKSQALSLSYHTITIIRMPNLAGSSNNAVRSVKGEKYSYISNNANCRATV